ncbi:sigma-70 family RNA polymerase sigma factor [Gorillibacterium sp. sgz5001074]|uniref:sigma-70 family RNA polymerase sigma factor n=1 Tax=Gorillibacterium sp. sgz5001074 TaxID=3446695 RepID=UPI003F67C6F8
MAVGHWNDSVLDLIPGYKEAQKRLEKVREQAEDKAWKETLGMCIQNVEYALEWMQHGGNPNRRRGVEKRYVRSWDPAWIDAYHSPNGWSVERESRDLTAEEWEKIKWAMEDLTDREKQMFMMYHVDGMSLSEISQELHVGRSTVQTTLDRAKEKIEYAKATSLFLL